MRNNNSSDQIYIYPTDTVWGMGFNIFSKAAFDSTLLLKGAREEKPFSILFSQIKMVIDYFNIPQEWNISVLEDLLKMKTTLGFPRHWLKRDIPKWLTFGSPYVAFRCLDIPEIQYILGKEGAPITSTSLNKSNQPPAKTLEEAKSFENLHLNVCKLISFSYREFSGNPSTIIFFEKENIYNIQRSGTNVGQIKEKIKLLST